MSERSGHSDCAETKLAPTTDNRVLQEGNEEEEILSDGEDALHRKEGGIAEERVNEKDADEDEITIGEDGVPTLKDRMGDTDSGELVEDVEISIGQDGIPTLKERATRRTIKPDPPAEHVEEQAEMPVEQTPGKEPGYQNQDEGPATSWLSMVEVPKWVVIMIGCLVVLLLLALIVVVVWVFNFDRDDGSSDVAQGDGNSPRPPTDGWGRPTSSPSPTGIRSPQPSPEIVPTQDPTNCLPSLDSCNGGNTEWAMTGELPGYGWIVHPSLDLSADGSVLVTRQGGNDGGGDLVQAWRLDPLTGQWGTMGTPLTGVGTFSLSHGASVLSLSADGTFLVVGTSLLQFWSYDASMDTWWGPGAGDAVGQPSITGVPNPDGDFYPSGYSVTLSNDASRFVMVGDAMTLQPIAAHVFDRSNVADWFVAGEPLLNEQLADITFAATLSGDGTTVALGAPDNNAAGLNRAGHVRVLRWDAPSGSWLPVGQTLQGSGAQMQLGNQITLSTDGRTMAVQTLTGVRIYRFDETSNEWLLLGSEIACRPNETTWPQHFSTLSGNGQVLAVAGCPGLGLAVDKDGMFGAFGNVRVYTMDESRFGEDQWGLLHEKDLYGIDQPESRVEALALSEDGSILATGSTAGSFGDGIVRIFARVQ